MESKVGIVGAGIMGRMLAHELLLKKWTVTLYDRGQTLADTSCSYVAGGMLCPISELVEGSRLVYELGVQSLLRWPDIIASLKEFQEVYFRREGSLLVAHCSDRDEWKRLHDRLSPLVSSHEMKKLTRSQFSEIEPELDCRIMEAILFPNEGQIDNREILTALGSSLQKQGANLRFAEEVVSVKPHQVVTKTTSDTFDWVVDCRGLGARTDLKDLRGVRGEIITVIAPEVRINRPVRVMHPRHPVYVVPRSNSKYLVGATCLETDDQGPITVRSMLELLSASFLVHPGFAEAKIIETNVQCRPALDDNNPQVRYRRGLVHVNGLYRNGFLVAPALADEVTQLLTQSSQPRWDLCREVA
jgi:glycine oxidase